MSQTDYYFNFNFTLRICKGKRKTQTDFKKANNISNRGSVLMSKSKGKTLESYLPLEELVIKKTAHPNLQLKF